MKKLISLFLTAALSLSLLTTALAAPTPKDPEPDPTPIVTLLPEDPEDPGISPQNIDEPPDEATKPTH